MRRELRRCGGWDCAQIARWQPALSAAVRSYGLCKDEYNETGHWTPQLYVRESIRLDGKVMLTQRNVVGEAAAVGDAGRWNTSVGLSKWGVDIHAVRRLAMPTGNGSWIISNAGGHDTMRSHDPPLSTSLVEVPYEALVPRADDTSNLLVPVAISATHVAFSTYRLEPQYAIFGHSAGAAAALSALAGGGVPVQDIDVGRLQSVLRAQNQILNASNPVPPHPAPSPPPGPTPSASAMLLLPCGDKGSKMHDRQRWTYYSSPSPSASPSLPSDRTLRWAADNATCVSIYGYSAHAGAAAWAAACHTRDKQPQHQNQEFLLLHPGSNTSIVQLRNTFSGLCLAGTRGVVDQAACSGNYTSWVRSPQQDWRLQHDSSLCLTAPGCSYRNCAKHKTGLGPPPL